MARRWWLLLPLCFASSASFRPFHLDADYVGIISHHEARQLLALRHAAHAVANAPLQVSLDLGRHATADHVEIADEGLLLRSGGESVCTWADLKKICKKADKGQQGCYQLFCDGSPPQKVSCLSPNTQRPASLMPPLYAGGAPTMLLGGFSMHRISGGDQKSSMDPMEDTRNKIAALGADRLYGEVLDTCCGLGYTAIEAARSSGVTKVVTIELDDASIEMCEANPWSWPLFGDEENLDVDLRRGDACEIVTSLADEQFSAIIHDPPALALCKDTDLYSLSFYEQLRRVLKRGGKIFHYIGNPDSKESGRLYRGISSRLQDAGFGSVKTDKTAFGLVAKRM